MGDQRGRHGQYRGTGITVAGRSLKTPTRRRGAPQIARNARDWSSRQAARRKPGGVGRGRGKIKLALRGQLVLRLLGATGRRRPTTPGDEPEFAKARAALSSEHEYRVERVLRDLIATEAYGAP